MTNHTDIQVPAGVLEIAAAAWFEAESNRKWEDARPESKDMYREFTAASLQAALPAIYEDFKARLLSRGATNAARAEARKVHIDLYNAGQFRGPGHPDVVVPIIAAALATAFPQQDPGGEGQ